MTLSACVCHSALIALAMSSPPTCSSGLSCRARDGPSISDATLLKTRTVDGALVKKDRILYGRRLFYNLAHMALREVAVDWAMKSGANGLEIDVIFTHENSAKDEGAFADTAYHGPYCDCTCFWHAWIPTHLCAATWYGGAGFNVFCEDESPFIDLLTYITLNYNSVSMIHLDDKMGDNYEGTRHYEGHRTATDMEATGKNLMNRFIFYTFRAGYKGDVTVGGVADTDQPSFFIGALKYMQFSGLVSRTWIAWEALKDGSTGLTLEEYNTANKGLEEKVGFSFSRARCDGISACIHVAANVAAIVFAGKSGTSDALAKRGDSLDYVIVWTVDEAISMRVYLDLGVDAAITNLPSLFAAVAKDANRPMPFK